MTVETKPGSLREGLRRSDSGEPMSVDRNQALVRQRINAAFKRQRILQASGRFDGFAGEALRTFVSDPMCQDVISAMKPYVAEFYELKDELLEGDEQLYRGKIRGKLLESLAYAVLSAKSSKSGRAVISPEETLSFFKALNPDKPLTHPTSFQTSIEGVSVADGLAVSSDGSVITDVFEYTTYLRSKMDGIQIDRHRANIQKHKMLNRAKLSIVYPKQEIAPEIAEALEGVSLIELPFTLAQFQALEERMYGEVLYDLGFTAGPKDIDNRKIYQAGASQLAAKAEAVTGIIDPRWMIYGMEKGRIPLPDKPQVLVEF